VKKLSATMFKKISLAEVRESSRRSNSEANNRIHWFSSKFSIYFSYIFINIGISADRITNLFLVAGVFGAIYVQYPVVSYLLWRVHIILDMSDGDIARFNQSFSSRGKYWDRLNHSIINPLFCFFIGNNFFTFYSDITYLYLGVILMFFQFLLLNVKYYQFGDSQSIRNKISGWNFGQILKNIFLDLLSMEGVILFLVLFARLIPEPLVLLIFYFYIVLFFIFAGIKFHAFSYK